MKEEVVQKETDTEMEDRVMGESEKKPEAEPIKKPSFAALLDSIGKLIDEHVEGVCKTCPLVTDVANKNGIFQKIKELIDG